MGVPRIGTAAPPAARVTVPPRRGEGRPALLVCGGVAAALLAFYLFPYPVGGFRLALGSDTPVYVWWARFAGAEGLGALGIDGRPATVGVLLTLASITGTSVAAVAEAIGAVLAAVLGLAAGATVETALGRDRVRFALAALLTGVFLSSLVSGYFSTLAFGATFLGALAVLPIAVASPRSGLAPVAGPAALLGAAGLSHPLFLLPATAVLAGSIVALLRTWRAEAAGGVPVPGRGASRVALSLTGGALVTVAGLPLFGGGGVDLETSRDEALRRLGLGRLVTESFRRKLVRDFPWWRALAQVGVALVPLVPAGWGRRLRFRARQAQSGAGPAGDGRARGTPRGDGPGWQPGPAVFWGAIGAWVALTAGGVVLLLAGAPSPGQRLAAFCLPLPLLAAVGLRALPGKLGARRRLGTWLAAVGVLLFVLPAWVKWADEYALVPPAAVAQSRLAGAALGRQPPGTPMIMLVEPRTLRPGLQATRYTNYLRAAVPPARVADVRYFVGTVADFRAGRPTLTGDFEHDRLARSSSRIARSLLGRSPLVVVMQSFDRIAYQAVLGLPEFQRNPPMFRLGRGVVMLPGFTGREHAPLAAGRLPDSLTEPGEGLLSPWLPVGMAPVLLGILAMLGAPWAWAGLRGASPLARVALAPAFGLAALGLSAVAVDATGVRLGGPGGLLAAALAGGVGAAVAIRTLSRDRPAAS